MPGRVVKVLVHKGVRVQQGDSVLVIEAMKMESRVPAPIDGTVSQVLVAEGEDIKTDETLIQIE
jgi:pyruvate carboxylase subunit B